MNNLAAVMPKLLAQGLLALRKACVMPLLVNRDYGTMAAQKGSTIDVPVPSAVAVADVVPGPYAPTPGALSPTSVSIPLDQWKEAPYVLTDDDLMKAMNGIIPMQASEAIKALAENVNAYIFQQAYRDFFGSVGTPGTTPFATDTKDATAVRAMLNKQMAPLGDRRFVIDPDAEANALNLRAFQDTSFSGDSGAILRGEIGMKLGFAWFMDQQVPAHARGTAANYTTNTTGYAAGLKEVNIITGTGTISVGDVFTFAGHTQQYVCTEALAAPGLLKFSPGLAVAIPASAVAITFKGTAGTTYPQNLAFHRDAIAFASRPLADNTQGLGNLVQSATDPLSGLSLRLEVSREHKQTRFSYDILYGCKTVRPEFGVRLWG